MQDIIEENQKSHKQEISIIEEFNKNLLEQNQIAIDEYQKHSMYLEEEYSKKYNEIQKRKTLEVQNVEKEFERKNYALLAKKIENQYGFKYVPSL